MSSDRALRVEGTRMFQEAARSSDAVHAQLRGDAAAMAAIGAELRRLAPLDHPAHLLKVTKTV